MGYEFDRDELDREIGERFTPGEIAMFRRQLAGAVSAIEQLRDRAPRVVQYFFANMGAVDAEDVSAGAQQALSTLADELRIARLNQVTRAVPVVVPSRQALRLVVSAQR